jgi:hypothetical protein
MAPEATWDFVAVDRVALHQHLHQPSDRLAFGGDDGTGKFVASSTLSSRLWLRC